MTHEEMKKVMGDFIEEYFWSGKYKHLNGKDGKNRPSEDDTKDYRRRLRSFIFDNNVPDSIQDKIADSGMGESFFMAHGYGILEEEGLV
jgi:hypothetical protein